jgi:tRNA-Thr(GGU) m(6)t(6)A37 methyltransferase TsaA
MNISEIVLKPVGVIKSEIMEPVLRADGEGITLNEKLEHVKAEHNRIRTMTSVIVVNPFLEELLDGIEGYSHLMVLYWAHKVPAESRRLTRVHPMGLKEMPQKGIFATCSPARPNPVLVTVVRLLERDENILKVQGLEAIDGSPVIDIKPCVQGYHGAENSKMPEWMEKIHKMLEEATP